MPWGESSFETKVDRVSATPSPSSSRSTVTLLASVTKTSPFGATWSHRGPSRSLANTFAAKPVGTVMVLPSGRGSYSGGLAELGVAPGAGSADGSIRICWPGDVICARTLPPTMSIAVTVKVRRERIAIAIVIQGYDAHPRRE